MKNEYPDTRVALWDNIKFLLIVLVVIGHFADVFTEKSDVCKSIFMFIYAFHMPLFLLIAGLFHRDRDIGKKVCFSLFAGFLLKIVTMGTEVIFNQSRPSFQLLSDSWLPWYMFAMAAFILLTYGLRRLNKRNILIFWVIVACFVGYDPSIGDFLYLSRIIIFYPFYLLGTLLSGQKIQAEKQKKRLAFPAWAALGGWACLCFLKPVDLYRFRHLVTGRNAFTEEIYSFAPAARLIYYALALVLCFAVIFVVPGKKIRLISRMGTRTLDVFFWHGVVYVIINHFWNLAALFSGGYVGEIAYFLLAVLISVLLAQGGIISFPLKVLKNAIFAKPGSQAVLPVFDSKKEQV